MDPNVNQQLADSLASLISRILNQATVPGLPTVEQVASWQAVLKFVSTEGNQSISGNKLFTQRVSIGLDASNYALGIYGAAGPAAGLELYEISTGTNKRLHVRQDPDAVIYNATFTSGGNAQQFQVGNVPAITINSDRRVSIGDIPSYQGKLTLVENTDVANYVWLRHNTNGVASYCGYILNAFGNSWALRMGSSVANGNTLEIVQDVGGTDNKRLVINTSGNVGIGSTQPASKLTVQGISGVNVTSIYGSSGIQIDGNNANVGQVGVTFQDGGGDAAMLFGRGGEFDTDIRFYTNPLGNNVNGAITERMRITSGGSLLLSTTDQFALNYRMYVQAPNPAAGMIAYKNFNETPCIPALFLNSAGLVVGSIQAGQNSTAYNTSSDYRLKEDWVPVSDACQKVLQLNPVNFAWKLTGQRVDGFLAHELAEVVPEAVTGEKDAVEYVEVEVEPAQYEDQIIPAELDEDGNVLVEERTHSVLVKPAVVETQEKPVYQGIDQAKLVPLLTAALQEAIERLQVAHDRIDELEQRIAALEDR